MDRNRFTTRQPYVLARFGNILTAFRSMTIHIDFPISIGKTARVFAPLTSSFKNLDPKSH